MATDRCDLLCLDLPRAEALRRDRLDAGEATRRAAVIAALGDPTRLVIALALRDGDELCVCDLAAALAMSQSAVSHSLRVLRQLRLVRSRKDGKTIYYHLDDAHIERLLGDGFEHVEEQL